MTPSPLARALTRLVLRHALAIVICGALVTAAGIALASRLSLQTDLAELLPERAPSVIALHALSKRVGGTGNVAIAVESLDGRPDALRAYMPLLADELRRDLGPQLLSLRYSRKEISDFYTKFAAYYAELADLERWSHMLSEAIAKQNPAYVELDDTAPDPLRVLADDVRAERDKLAPKQQADPQTGLLMTEGGGLAVIFVRPASDSLNLGGAGGMLERIKLVVASTHPADHGVRIAGYTGSIPVALTEVDAIRHDIVSTALFVILGVGLVVILFFRGFRELALMSSAVIVGTSVALGFAEIWLGHVNAQTAFLGAIILGTGINYSLILLDRYRQARTSNRSFEDALESAIDQTLRATGIAALATAVSFGVLGAGEIESFHQFGAIGLIGILACWIATFSVVPACVVLADRGRPPRTRPHGFSIGLRQIGEACARTPRFFLGMSAALVVASVALAVSGRHDVIETDLRKLGTRSSETGGIERLDNRLRKMDDRSSTPAVIATGSREESDEACAILNAKATSDLKGILRRCYSLDDLFPRDTDRRAAVIAKLRQDVEQIDDDDVAPADRKDVADLRRALNEAPPDVSDLPSSLREYFVERDGSIGKLAFVEPNNEHIEHNLNAFTDAMREIRLPSGKVIESSGDLVVFADVLRAMRRDTVKLTLASALLVLLVLGIITRRVGAFVRVGGALFAGVAVMAGIAVMCDIKLNFFNFVALPTTFGIGIDYAINIEERIEQLGGDVVTAIREVGGAVLLASTTSIIGYASLLIADSRALASFGALAMIGELTCVIVALLVVPSLWALRRRQR
ncbi:MAG TPA: MMPL family transporter [Kofleriaceae bacterium]|jgi:hypothetical protein